MYNTRGCWDFGLYLSSGILKNTAFQKLDLFPSSDEREGDSYSVGSSKKSLPRSVYVDWIHLVYSRD
jgi:hypothetical protein